MNRLALRIAAATLFSADVDDDADAIGGAVTEAMDVFPASLSAFGELLDLIPFHPATRRFTRARAQLDAVIYRLIEQRRSEPADRGDLLSILLQLARRGGPADARRAGPRRGAHAAAGRPRDDRQRADLGLGHARAHARPPRPGCTPSSTRCWASATRCRTTCRGCASRATSWPRCCGCARRPGSSAAGWCGRSASARGSCRPARSRSRRRSSPTATRPTGANPRRSGRSAGPAARRTRCRSSPTSRSAAATAICIGEGFAWTEAVLILATLARRFRFRATDASPVPLDPLVTLRPGRTITMRVEERPRIPVGV